MAPAASINRSRFHVSTHNLRICPSGKTPNLTKKMIPHTSAHNFRKTKFMMPNVQLEVELVIDKLIRSFENRLDRAKLERSEKFVTLDFEETSLRYAIALVLTCLYKQDEVVDFEGETDRFTQIVESGLKNTINSALRFCVMFPLFIPIVNWLLQFHPTGKMRSVLMSFVKQQTLIGLKARQQVGRAATNFNKTNAPGAGHTFDSDNFLLDDGTKFRRNMIDYIIDQFHDGKLTKSEYLNNSFFLFLASSKSSADAICKLIYNLAANQDEQDKLRAAVVSDGPDSEYLHWSIFESMRLFPPGPWGCSRRLSSDLETEDGVKIPAGTVVYTPPNIIHRLKEYWGPDANEYNPERWRHSASFHPAQFMGFGLGKRNCFGGQFAVSQIKMLMSKLLARYKFNLAADTNAQTINEFDTFLIFTSSDLPTNIEISRV